MYIHNLYASIIYNLFLFHIFNMLLLLLLMLLLAGYALNLIVIQI